MKQLVQSAREGTATVVEVPAPTVQPGHVLVQVAASVVSPGTERQMIEFAGKGLLGKARARPDLVRQVIGKARREGVLSTIEGVRERLDRPLTLGYSNAGTVLAVGDGVEKFRTGDRVACAGAGYAVHAEVVSVPKNLVVKLPESIGLESGAFTTIGAIATHGLRQAEIRLGEDVAVIGLGLVGLLTVQIARAGGCRVVGMDPRQERCDLAAELGCKAALTDSAQLADRISEITEGRGADRVIICAADPGNEAVELAGRIARDRGTIVAVGDVGMDIPRQTYYEKELTFRVSRSYGPGRYDPEYEEKGQDYPIGYVRWTENRNMQAFVRLVADGKVLLERLITHRFPIEEAPEAYRLISGERREEALGVLITCGDGTDPARRIDLRTSDDGRRPQSSSKLAVGLLGAGTFATTTLLPAMKKVSGVELIGVCTATGASSRHAGDRYGFRYCTTDEEEVLRDPQVDTVAIATRNHLHARQVIAALEAGKHVFCEKPLAVNEAQLGDVVGEFYAAGKESQSRRDGGTQAADVGDRQPSTAPAPILTVGFNRRFAPMATQLKAFFEETEGPLVMNYRVNAGPVAGDHWVHDPEQGGGRIVSEVCHFVDFITYLAGTVPVRVQAQGLPNGGRLNHENVVATLELSDGSVGSVTYVAGGDQRLPKERVEVFGGGAAAVLDDFRRLELIRGGHRKVYRSRLRQDKGHRLQWEALLGAVRSGGPAPIPFEEIVAASLATYRIVEAMQMGAPVEMDVAGFISSAVGPDRKGGRTKDAD